MDKNSPPHRLVYSFNYTNGENNSLLGRTDLVQKASQNIFRVNPLIHLFKLFVLLEVRPLINRTLKKAKQKMGIFHVH